MTTDFRNRRRNFYIKKEFQRNFILKFCALVAAGATLSGLIVYMLSTSTVTTTFENSRLTIKGTADYILPAILISGVVVVALIGVATIFITLFTSHKIAGALYAIEKRVDEVAALNLKTEFHLRTDDQIKPLAVGLGVMASKLRIGVKEIKDTLSALDAVVDSRGRGNIPADIVSKIDELKTKVGKFNT